MNETKNILEGTLELPIGKSDWAEFSRTDYCVDKTLFIRYLVDYPVMVSIYTRPRGFGKSTALNMVRSFFEKTEADTSYLFRDKKIWAAGEKYQALQGTYRVLYVSFAGFHAETWEAASEELRRRIVSEVERHKADILSEKEEDEWTTRNVMRILDPETSIEQLDHAFDLVAGALHKKDKQKVIILMDDYDLPLREAALHGYYKVMNNFMLSLLSCTYKDSHHCKFGILMGEVRGERESSFSGFNNAVEVSVRDYWTSEFFGFTADEVQAMAEYYGVPEKVEEIRDWYGGYRCRDVELFNPCSVLAYFREGCKTGPHWVEANTDAYIVEIFENLSEYGKERLGEIFQEGSGVAWLDSRFRSYEELSTNRGESYAYLVACGYLSSKDIKDFDAYEVFYPNREIATYVRDVTHSDWGEWMGVRTRDDKKGER